MSGWIQRRLAEIDALLSPTFLDISARHAEIRFNEADAGAKPSEPSWWYPREIELHLWAIDEEKNEARSQTSFEWARDQGLVPDLEMDAADQA